MKKLLLVIFILLLPSIASAATIGKVNANNIGLVGYWTFDGAQTNWGTNKTFDSSGLGNTGTLTGLPTSTAPMVGKPGQALLFKHGVANYMQLSSTTATSMNYNFTISAWVYPTVSGTSRAIINKGSQFSSVGQYVIFVDNAGGSATITAAVGDGTTQQFRSSSATPIPLNQWSHVVFSSDATTMYFYINGVARGTGDRSNIGTTFTGDSWFSIGTSNSNQGYYDGGIDETRIYNRVLSATEVKALYNSGSAKVGRTTASPGASTTPLSNGLVGYWTLDGSKINWATGSTSDSSGQGNTGTLVNFSTTTSPGFGKAGQALQFNGNIYVSNPSSIQLLTTGSTLNFGNNSFTFAAWIYPTDTSVRRAIFQSSTNSNTHWEFQTDIGGAIQFKQLVRAQFSDYTLSPGVTVVPNKWYHVVGSYASSTNTLKVYVNGVLKNQSNPYPTTIIQTGPAPASIGSDFGQQDQIPFKGMEDDVRFYNRALSDAEVAALYQLGSAKVGVSGAVSGTTTAPLSNGLVGYWTLDGSKTNWATGSTSDSSGNRNTGQLVSMSTTSSPAIGKVGQALKFDGIDDWVDAGNQTTPTTMTYAMWIKPHTIPVSGAYGEPLRKEGSFYASFDNFNNVGVKLGIKANGNNDYFVNVPFSAFPLDTWKHIAITVDGSTVRAYLNGILFGSTAYIGPIENIANNHIFIGTYGTNATPSLGRWFDGAIDDVRIYNRAFSSAEVKALYTATK